MRQFIDIVSQPKPVRLDEKPFDFLNRLRGRQAQPAAQTPAPAAPAAQPQASTPPPAATNASPATPVAATAPAPAAPAAQPAARAATGTAPAPRQRLDAYVRLMIMTGTVGADQREALYQDAADMDKYVPSLVKRVSAEVTDHVRNGPQAGGLDDQQMLQMMKLLATVDRPSYDKLIGNLYQKYERKPEQVAALKPLMGTSVG